MVATVVPQVDQPRCDGRPGADELLRRRARALGSVQAPTLVLHAARERFIPARTAATSPNASRARAYVELEGADHFPYLANGDTIVEEIQEFLTGVREPAEPDRVLATVLFSDIVGSTERPRHWAIGAGARCSKPTTEPCAGNSSDIAAAR